MMLHEAFHQIDDYENDNSSSSLFDTQIPTGIISVF